MKNILKSDIKIYKFLSRGVLILHILWAWVVASGVFFYSFWVWYWKLGLIISIITLISFMVSGIFKLGCILTVLEKKLIGLADSKLVYRGTCIIHYLKRHYNVRISQITIVILLIILVITYSLQFYLL
ncbi:hypothetical protein A2995_00330 [Candidatus Nomurabacteria bacterium RIFCSPLOWO2_01_FULL_33_24]|uniref:DUF2784 domain-containing protein n=1 Tax=Candidatus Nomurabacteria bacterium RIFCSPLOWO2_01_FULL_33_24 TaxID=1801765 RepID=A0A1F6X221_9BACT|nr:MAG: hypothetical protein A2995_00330 [Candidatus Nomurabacteria bacterium RIFCSPLOWO2_01_FULL_33_24]